MDLAVVKSPVEPIAEQPPPRIWKRNGLSQAYDLRDLAAETALALRQDMMNEQGKLIIRRDEFGKPVDAAAISQLIRAWFDAVERIAVFKGQGKPRPVTARNDPSARKQKRSGPAKPVFSRVHEEQAPTPVPTQPEQPLEHNGQ